MTELWCTTSLSPVAPVTFNWKIENFDKVVKIFGGKSDYESEYFSVSSRDGEDNSVKLVMKKCSRARAVSFKVVSCEDKLLYLSGSLVVDADGDTFEGVFGDPEKDEFECNTVFLFKKKKSGRNYGSDSGSGSDDSYAGSNTTGNILQIPFDASMTTVNVRVQLTMPGIVGHVVSLVPSEKTVNEIGSARLVKDIKSLFNRVNECSDFAIACEDKIFKCHETILRMRSPVFEKMFQLKMSESTDRKMNISDVKKNTVEALLEYLYTGEVLMKVDNESELIYIADKYEIAGLLELCFHKLPEVEEDMVVDILIMADRHNLANFKKIAMERIEMNKDKYWNDENFANKLKEIPSLLVEYIKLFN